MATWRYEGLDRAGGSANGTVTAPDQASAMRMVLARGFTPLRLESDEPVTVVAARTDAPAASRPAWLPGSGRPTMKRAELANLIREVATAVEAGLPLMQSLRTVRRQASGKAQPVILDALIEKVEAGRPLHEAMQAWGAPFDDMTVGMVRAADASGRMSEVLHQLADLLDRSVELRRELIGATIYPMIVAGLIMASVVLLVTVILPQLMAPIAGQPGMVLPLPTRILLAFAAFMTTWWPMVILGGAGVVVAVQRWLARPSNRLLWDGVLLRMPLLGPLLRDVAVARFTRTLGTLVNAGLPILQALRITRDTLGNAVLTQAVDQVQEKVTTGQALADPLERCGFFPPLLIQIVNIGERSGRLETMLLHAANAFDRQVNASIKLFTKALPPVLLVFMAIVAGFVLAGILLPLLQMQSALGA
ncbi:MAG: ral secretion pathway protein [Planctomycetota bacterium]